MSNLRERYAKRFEPVDLTTEDGYIWRVRRMTSVSWGVIAGGFLTFATAHANGDGPPRILSADQQLEQANEHRRLVYEHLVDGLVDEETGEVDHKPTFEEADPIHVTMIVAWQNGQAPNKGNTAALIARSLHGPEVGGDGRLAGAAVLEAPVGSPGG